MSGVFVGHPFAVETARNMVLNPSFESGVTGWIVSGSSGSPFITSEAGGAIRGGRVGVLRTGGSGVTTYLVSAHVACTAGATYTASIFTRNPGSVTHSVQVNIEYYGADGALLTKTVGAVSTPPTTWIRYATTGTAPAAAVMVALSISVTGQASSGEWHYFDAGMLTETPAVLDYFDGDTADTATVEYAWAGSPSGSQSVQFTFDAELDQVSPALVLAPWSAGAESRAVVHTYMDAPASAMTWRPPAPRTGELDLLFDTPDDAAAAYRFFTTRRWFGYDGDGDVFAVPAFCVTPGASVQYGHTDDARIRNTDGEQVWHVTVPWTEVGA